MPNDGINIYMSLIDKVSSPLDGIGKKTKVFSKELQELEQKTAAYAKTQDKLSKETLDYRKKLEQATLTVQTAKKEFKKYKDEAHKGALDKAIEEQEEYKRKLRESEAAMKSNYKALGSMMDQQRKAGNLGGSEIATLGKKLGDSGILKMFGSSLSGAASAYLSSAIGEPEARLAAGIVSGALEGAASGALMGKVLGVPGVAAGAAIGGISGLLAGGTEFLGARNDAFKSYYGDQYRAATSRRASELEEGSGIAGGRESTRMAFNKLLGGEDEAGAYLKEVQTLAVDTNYTYDEITGYTKKLLNSFKPKDVLNILTELSDATAGLSLSSSDVDQFVSGLNRMTTTGKATREWLNYFDERGLDTSAALAAYLGKDKSDISDMVTKGTITGGQAVEAIRAYIRGEYGGLSAELAGSYNAMVDNLGDTMDNINAALGDAYNEANKAGIGADLEAYGGTLGGAMEDMNRMIGEGKGIADNLDRRYSREAMSALVLGEQTTVYGEAQAERLQQMHEEYTSLVDQWQTASEEEKAGIAATLEGLKSEAETMAESAYNASDMAQDLQDVELDLIAAIRENTKALGFAAYGADYNRQHALSLGLGPGGGTATGNQAAIRGRSRGFAVGLNRVPYDNFPALLHEGERVLTASQARAEERGGPTVQVTVTGNSFYGSDAAMEDRVAQKVAREVARAVQLGV